MLIYLTEWLRDLLGDLPGANLFRFLSFRAGLAIIISLLISMVSGGRIIGWLRRMQMGESVRDLGLDGQKQKEGTPTMGGLIIILAIVVPCLLVSKLDNIYVITMLVATIWMAGIGFIDDYLKIKRKNKDGLAGKFKILGQVGLGVFISLVMLFSEQIVVRMDVNEATAAGISTEQMVGQPATIQLDEGGTVTRANFRTQLTNFPFLKGSVFNYENLFHLGRNLVWILFIPLIVFIITAISNAANLTDGLDGLATGVSAISATVLTVFAYVGSNAIIANYLGILHLPGTEELVIYSACLVGACLGFLWHNSFPAAVFMGDTGSLALGGVIASLAVLLRKEWLLPILCGIFVLENLSVIIQVTYFKYTKRKYGEGRRIFLMSPLHHHYQKKGMSEVKIVTRFWIVAILFAVGAILSLKLR
ncbi:phospho-N-acetylmuramoyl-pentapeptide-transferase [Lewinellaceae bacterium SD302]|nr:phospho-N-acetylmuramoyl-pentapeptide-transferase [Lewinellaceae bacterium SD302]